MGAGRAGKGARQDRDIKMTFTIRWHDSGSEPRVPPNPQYPDGVDVDLSNGAMPSCQTAVPYPAKRCGIYALVCDTCGLVVAVTTAGRPDDPRSVRVRCRGRAT